MIGPNRAEWFEALQQVGVPIWTYAENAFLILANPSSVASLRTNPAFQLVAVYQPALKITTPLLDYLGVLPGVVVLDGSQDLAGVRAMLESLAGGQVTFEPEGPTRDTVLQLTASEVQALAFLPEVLRLEEAGQAQLSDERQALVVGGQHNGTQPINPTTYDDWLLLKNFCTTTGMPPGCYSASANVAVFDTGLDQNICPTSDPTCPSGVQTQHPDLQTRETRFYCANRGSTNACYGFDGGYLTSYAYSDNVAHGTAVASIIAGDPLKPGTGVEARWGLGKDQNNFYLGSGIAPLAKILTFRIWNNRAVEFGSLGQYAPADFETWYGQLPADPQTRFSNNSWGYYNDTSYSTYSYKFDQLVRDSNGGYNDFGHPMTIVFAAGNKEIGGFEQVLPPANAKNVISVGAEESYRQSDVPPWDLQDCKVASSIKNIATFSNRAVQPDPNRLKPDFVEPATRLGAAFTRGDPHYYGSCIIAPNGGDPNGGYYTRFWGTSGAAPVVTGMAVLVDEWYFRRVQAARPSPAMVKAMLVAHADDLYGGMDQRTSQTLGHRPTMPQGWGRPNLDKLFQTAVGTLYFDEDHATSPTRRFRPNQASWTVNVQVADPTKDVILAMAFSDCPATPGASPLKVNNLDLYVRDAGYSYVGNYFDTQGYSTRTAQPPSGDANNNVELIRIRPGEILNNDFTIEVVPQQLAGHAVPGIDGSFTPNQDFALYVYNAH